jgi:hypothetical protein
VNAQGETRSDGKGGTADMSARAFGGQLRLVFVLFGAMLALQSSPTLDATKIVYAGGTLICLIGAFAAVWSARRTPEVIRAIPWLLASAAVALLIAISFLVARANGTPVSDWVRDTAAYALFAAVPLLALDAQASASRKLLVAMLLVAGLMGGLSWAVEWLHRREMLDLPLARLVFPSGLLPGLLYLFAMAMALTAERRRGAWTAVAGVTLGLFLVTGTRSSLLLLAGPLAMVAILGLDRIWRSIGILAVHALVAVAIVFVFQLAVVPAAEDHGQPSAEPGGSPPLSSAPANVGDRFGTLPRIFANPGSDPSYKERAAQYVAAWKLFASSPIVGVGPGHGIDWIDVSGFPRSEFTADTPLVLPAKFGLVGVLTFLGIAAVYASMVWRGMRRNRRSPIALTLVGFGVLMIVTLPLGFPVEDKGTSLALLLLLSLAFANGAAARTSESTAATLPA